MCALVYENGHMCARSAMTGFLCQELTQRVVYDGFAVIHVHSVLVGR